MLRFSIYINQGSWSTILFFCCVFIWFGYQGNTNFIKEVLTVFLLFLLYGISWEELALVSWGSDKITSESVWAWELFSQDFVTDSISLLVINLLNSFITVCFHFVMPHVSRTPSISFRFSNLLDYLLLVYALLTFWIVLVPLVIFPFLPLVVLIWVSCLFHS